MQFARCVDDHQLTPVCIRPLDERLAEAAGIGGRGDIEPGRRRFQHQRGR
jgi:hypothetical protein